MGISLSAAGFSFLNWVQYVIKCLKSYHISEKLKAQDSWLKRRIELENKALSQEVTKGKNCMCPSAYSSGWWISISFQMQNCQMHSLCCHFCESPVSFRKQVGAWEKNSEMTVLVFFEVLCWLCCVVLCLFTRLFKDRRVGLTLSLFFTSLFAWIMPQIFFQQPASLQQNLSCL